MWCVFISIRLCLSWCVAFVLVLTCGVILYYIILYIIISYTILFYPQSFPSSSPLPLPSFSSQSIIPPHSSPFLNLIYHPFLSHPPLPPFPILSSSPSSSSKVYVSVFIVGYLYLLIFQSSKTDPACFIGVDG